MEKVKKRSPRKKKINDSSDFPVDFWNYLVNPIVGYYVDQPSLLKYKDK